MANETTKEVGYTRTLRVQKNGRDALTMVIDGVRVRLMASGHDPKARALLADLYESDRVAITYTEKVR